MRALGPGSVSSLLKIGLDVFWWALVGLTVLVALAVLAALVLPRLPEMWAAGARCGGRPAADPGHPPPPRRPADAAGRSIARSCC